MTYPREQAHDDLICASTSPFTPEPCSCHQHSFSRNGRILARSLVEMMFSYSVLEQPVAVIFYSSASLKRTFTHSQLKGSCMSPRFHYPK